MRYLISQVWREQTLKLMYICFYNANGMIKKNIKVEKYQMTDR